MTAAQDIIQLRQVVDRGTLRDISIAWKMALYLGSNVGELDMKITLWRTSTAVIRHGEKRGLWNYRDRWGKCDRWDTVTYGYNSE